MKHREILLTPGPTPVPEEVREVLAQPIFHHRTPRYRQIFASVVERLKKVFRTASPVYALAGSGTAAMEAAIVNFHSPGDEILVAEGGKFAERFTNIARAYGLKPTVIAVPWGEAVKPAEIGTALEKNPHLKSVCIELCETSTGALTDVAAVGRIVRKSDAILIVDAISGLGADRLETDAWGVDIAVGASQKALMLPPGLAFLSVSPRAHERMGKARLPKFYLDLKLYEKALKEADTPFTPALSLVVGLAKALAILEREGLDNVLKRCAELGEWTRERLKAMGLELYSKAPSSTVSAACVPSGVDGEALVKTLRDEKGVSLAGGQGHLKGKIVRVAHMGAITKQDLEEGLEALEETLAQVKA